MRRLAIISVLMAFMLLLISANAFAALIDFRVAPFGSDADGATSYSATVGDLTLTFTPIGPQHTTPLLYWDSVDGFGVKGDGGGESDEVEYSEELRIDFSSTAYVTDFYLTDLFYEGGSFEEGKYSLDGWQTFTSFQQNDPQARNGAYTLEINAYVNSIWFTSLDGNFDEFSVAGVKHTNPQNAVPEPSTMLLLGSGLVGWAGLRRKFRKK